MKKKYTEEDLKKAFECGWIAARKYYNPDIGPYFSYRRYESLNREFNLKIIEERPEKEWE